MSDDFLSRRTIRFVDPVRPSTMGSRYANTIAFANSLREGIDSILNAMPSLPEEQDERNREEQALFNLKPTLESCLSLFPKAFKSKRPECPTLRQRRW
jgi:hypothetical protein